MSTVQVIKESSKSIFHLVPFQLKVDECNSVLHWSRNFWEMFSLISFFEKLLSHEALVKEGVTSISKNLHEQSNAAWEGTTDEWNCSSDVGNCEALRSKFFSKGFSFKSFSLIEYAFANPFKCFFDRNVWPPGQRAEIPERISPESLQEIFTKFNEFAERVWLTWN